MDGPTLITLATELNGGAAIGDTLLYQFLNIAKAMVEQLRPWMLLRKTDTSKTVAASTSAWQTAIDLKRLQLAAGRIAAGDLSPPEQRRVPNREMSELQSSFVTMAAMVMK